MKYITVGDCCDILDSQRVPVTASNRTKGIYPYYGANGVQDYVDDFLFDDELVLVAEDGGHFGSKEHPIAYRVSGKCWVNNHAHVLKPREGIDIDYLCYSLMYYPVQSLIKGATRKKLNQAELREMKIALRPLGEQKRIVTLIKGAEGESKLCREIVVKLDTLVKSRFIEMFGDPVTNPMGWAVSTLDKHLEVIGGYAFKSSDFADDGIPVLRIGNINSGKFQQTNMVYWIKDETLLRYEIHPGDLVISLTGTVGKSDYGNVCIMGDDYPLYYLNQRNAKLSLFSSLSPQYLAEVLKDEAIKGRLTGISRGIRQANIANRDILNLVIPIPPIALQNQFADFVQQVDKSKSVLQKLLEKQELLRAALMQEYFG